MKFLKNRYVQLVAAFLAGIVVCLLSNRPKDKVYVPFPEVNIKRYFDEIESFTKILSDWEYPHAETIITNITDTLIIDSSTVFGDIPVRETTFRDSMPWRDGKKRPYDLTVCYQGMFYWYQIRLPAMVETVTVAVPTIALLKRVGVYTDPNLYILVEPAVVITYKNKLSLVARFAVVRDTTTHFEPRLGVEYVF